ncbi:MAG: hypothetical protein JSW61_04785 [Candidatus Thorarchaeota archaeon]|nr:MAG: hypothetical protein JSW61_04785 [Candidatus Thorarchaeota archaeon]
MSGELSNIAKYIFLFGFIVSLIFGAWFFASPESWSAITGWPTETASSRIVGALLIAFAAGAILAYRETSWDRVEVYVLMSIVWTILGTVGMVWNIAVMTLPPASWFTTGLLVLFFVLYFYVYYQAKRQ